MSKILQKLDLANKFKKEEQSMLSKDRSSGFDSFGVGEEASETVLSSDVSFKGSIKFKNSLRIDGKFEGDISSKGTLFIGRTGEIKAEIKVGTAIIEGMVNGNIVAEEKVELKSTAHLFGDVKAARIAIAEGVTFVGKCNVNPSNEKPELDLSASESNTDEKKDDKDKKNISKPQLNL